MLVDNEIDVFILKGVKEHPRDIVRLAAEHFKYSRQGIHSHVKQLLRRGLLSAEGQTRARVYSLPTLEDKMASFNIADLEEDVIWREVASPLLQEDADNVRKISQYGFTEILNNAIVHSAGRRVFVRIRSTAANIEYTISDDGIGIFRKIKDECHLEDERHSILELAKGKLTTNPARHSGEGIFFTTRSFDRVLIASGELDFIHVSSGDWLMDDSEPLEGTFVSMEIDRFTRRSLREVFDSYSSSNDDYGFTKTQIPVFLAKYGDENLVSRSQAKRVVARLERFKEVVLDFDNVSSIGQAFADEIFRVFWQANPDVHLIWVNTNREVESMIHRALGRSSSEEQLRLV